MFFRLDRYENDNLSATRSGPEQSSAGNEAISFRPIQERIRFFESNITSQTQPRNKDPKGILCDTLPQNTEQSGKRSRASKRPAEGLDLTSQRKRPKLCSLVATSLSESSMQISVEDVAEAVVGSNPLLLLASNENAQQVLKMSKN